MTDDDKRLEEIRERARYRTYPMFMAPQGEIDRRDLLYRLDAAYAKIERLGAQVEPINFDDVASFVGLAA